MMDKELALDRLKTSYWKDGQLHINEQISIDDAVELIELASKPDWFYLSDGDFPVKNSC